MVVQCRAPWIPGLIDMNSVVTARPHTYAVRSGGTFAYSSLGLDRWVICGVFPWNSNCSDARLEQLNAISYFGVINHF